MSSSASSSSSSAAAVPGSVSGNGTLTLVDSSASTIVNSALELHLQLALPVAANTVVAPKKRVGMVLCIDRSGSMSGNFERQVVPALLYVAERALALDVDVRLVLYDSSAEIVRYTADNYKQVIGRLRTAGSTSFRSAFAMTWTAICELPTNVDEVVIGFLTDGQNTDASYEEALANLQANLRRAKFSSVCHSIAFSSGHDFAFLNRLRTTLGLSEGGFQYAEPNDGPSALEEKLAAIFDVAAVARVECQLRIAVNGVQFLVAGADGNDNAVDAITHTERVVVGQEFVVRAMCRATGAHHDSAKYTATVTCAAAGYPEPIVGQVALVARVVPKAKLGALRAQQNFARLEQLEQACGALVSITGEERSAALKKISDQLARAVADMAALQSTADLFSLCGTKVQRRAMFDLISQFSVKSAEITKLVSTLAVGSLTNAQKARLSELAHGQQFKQARRQRDMDQRSARNVDTLKKAEQALLELQLDKAAIAAVAEDAANEFRCVLTQDTWADMIGGDATPLEYDVVCFGLAVQRPESIVDDPTQLRVRDVSVTSVGHAAFEDAVIYKLATDNRFARNDVFDVAGEVSVALRGMGREPINAVLPLFIHREHWKVVVTQLPSLLGYLCCLDPLGFNSNQFDCFFLVLGTMAMAMRAPGEKELRLLLQFHRTAIAVLHDCKWLKRAETAVASFIESPAARLKDQCPNVVVLVGYLMCLPSETVERLLPTADAWRAFWLNVFGESLRRASDGVYAAEKTELASELVNAVVHGDDNDAPLDDNAIAAHPFCDAKRGAPADAAAKPRPGARGGDDDDDEDGDDDGFRGGKGGAAAAAATPAKQKARAGKGQAAPAVAASAKVRTRRRHTLPAGLIVDSKLEEAAAVRARVLLNDTNLMSVDESAADADKWRVDDVTKSMLEALQAFSTSLGGRAFPSVASLLSLATYTRVFHTLARDRGSVDALVAEIDAGFGVASTALCNGVKAAFVARGEYGNALVSVVCRAQRPAMRRRRRRDADDAHRGAAAARDRRAQHSVARQQDGARGVRGQDRWCGNAGCVGARAARDCAQAAHGSERGRGGAQVALAHSRPLHRQLPAHRKHGCVHWLAGVRGRLRGHAIQRGVSRADGSLCRRQRRRTHQARR
jgi:hypothetical protein